MRKKWSTEERKQIIYKYIGGILKKYNMSEGLIDSCIAEQDAVDCLKNLYNGLYVIVNEKNNHPNKRRGALTICPAIKGALYDEGPKPMFIGRAVNGWCPIDSSMAEEDKGDFSKRIVRCEGCTLDWVNGENVWDHCIKNGCIFANKERTDGRDKMSPFWQMVKFIYEKQYNNRVEDKKWYKKVLWSNLYKASFVSGGNPDRFYKEQVLICNAILILEIILYKPSAIYFITEKNRKNGLKTRSWFCDKNYNTDENYQELYEFLANSEWKDKVFVLMRPEFQNIENIWDQKEGLYIKGKGK